jgi:hypothetical protein
MVQFVNFFFLTSIDLSPLVLLVCDLAFNLPVFVEQNSLQPINFVLELSNTNVISLIFCGSRNFIFELPVFVLQISNFLLKHS